MLIPKPLYEVICIFPQKYTDRLLIELGKEEIIQIKEFKEKYKKVPSIDSPLIKTNNVVKALMRLDYIVDKLKIPKSDSIKEIDSPVKSAEEIVNEIEQAHSTIKDRINKDIKKTHTLTLYLEFVNSIKKIKFREKDVSFLIATEYKEWKSIKKGLKKENIVYSSIKKRISGEKVLRLLSIKIENEKYAENRLTDLNYYKGKIRDIESMINKEIKLAEKRIKENKDELEKLPGEYSLSVYSLKEKLELKLKILENKRKFLCSEFITLINCWIARSDFKRLKKIISKETENNYIIYKEKPDIRDNPPTKLSNFFLFEPFEMLLEGFSLPGYKDIDPTFIMGLFFPLFFGIMLSDAGYGMLLLLISFFLIFKKGNMKKFGEILLICSVFTLATGVYFGSWFGFNFTESYINPLKKPIELMVFSLVVGVFYVNLSLILGLVQSIIKKDWNFLFNEILLWLIFEIGIVFLIFPEIFSEHTNLPLHTIFLTGPVLARIFSKGILNILDFPKFFSTIISFIRLSALAMSTAWISFAINLIYRLTLKFPKGIYIGIIVLVLGHLFNFAFNTFGSFLQAMRLHYVEFLGQFYLGKGEKMQIFSIKK
ncbi:hypothetical protein GF327_07140 [Candidatus Woesearchaeota archaeon]|nr:hypothetical protein [Candidatus Woesearchaeota archaeon]